MRNLKTTILGYYVPSFFQMYVDIANDDMTIQNLSDVDANVVFHEYIHFLQDFTTYYGANNLYVQSEYFHSVVNRVKNKQQIQVPFEIEDNSDNVWLNLQLGKLTYGDSEEAQRYSIESVEIYPDDIILNEESYKKIDSACLNYYGESPRSFGALAIMESMADILERLCSRSSYKKSPEFPYYAAELVAQYYDSNFGQNLEKVLALCDMSLQSTNPGCRFVFIMKEIQNGKLCFDTAEAVYDYFYNQKVFVDKNVLTFNEAFEKIISTVEGCLNDYIKGVPQLETFHVWINRLVNFAKEWRANDRYFLLKMARQPILKKNNCWGYSIARVGSPLMVNRNEHYYKIPYAGMCEGENVEMFRALREIHLLFSQGQKKCGMLRWCKESPDSTPNELCSSAPWLKVKEDRLCPYAFIWKHWGLKNKEII